MIQVSEKHPKLEGKLVLIINGGYQEEEMWEKVGCILTDDPMKADIMMWTGGSDVNPALYGERPMWCTGFDNKRDAEEIKYWRLAKKDCLRVGVCRGGQFLNVMNGGKLWQDVDCHTFQHSVIDLETKRRWNVSSTHHQQFRPNFRDAIIVATTQLSTSKRGQLDQWKKLPTEHNYDGNEWATDYEVLWYPPTRSLCFQGHPEYRVPTDCVEYFMLLMERYI